MSFVDDVEDIVRRHADVADVSLQHAQIDDALAVLCGPESGDILWRGYRTYGVQMGRVDMRVERYRWLRSLEIASAPDVIAKFPISEGGHVIVTRYWATREDEDLVPAATEGVTFSEQARAQFWHDIETLSKHDHRHLYAGRGLNYWSVGSVSGVITLQGWSALVEGASGEDERAIQELLASRAA